MTIAAIAIGVVLTVAALCWMLMNRKHPETAASHHEGSLRASRPQPTKSPAGPDAEPDAVTGRGRITPHPHGSKR